MSKPIAFLSAALLAATTSMAVAQSTAPTTPVPGTRPPSSSPAQPPAAQGGTRPAEPTTSGSTGDVTPGRNSFTEGQARSRIEAQGYTDVSGLAKNDQGIWTGSAKKGGSPVTVQLDYQGRVAEAH